MPITRAGPSDARRIQQLITSSRYTYTNFGTEDLSTLLSDGIVVISTENGHPNAYLCIKRDGTQAGYSSSSSNENESVQNIQAAAAAEYIGSVQFRREYVRGIAIEQGQSPTERLAALLDAAIAEIQSESADPFEFICYGSERWLVRALTSAGFATQERIEFFRLDQPGRYAGNSEGDTRAPPIQIRGLYSNELKQLVALDASAFDSFWHLNQPQMLEMLFRSRVRVAVKDQELVGYSALILSRDDADEFTRNPVELSVEAQHKNQAYTEAQLARLAIHPLYHGHGFGRRLLVEVIDYAHEQGVQSITLNTQTSNRQSRRLYKSFGFRTTGHILPVLCKIVHGGG